MHRFLGIPSSSLSITLPPHSAPPNGQDMQLHQRTVQSLEKEIMRLQEVLKEREKEISLLEGREIDDQQLVTAKPPIVNGVVNDRDPTADYLSPKTMGQFENIKKGMVNGSSSTVNGNGNGDNAGGDNESEKPESVISEADENLERLNELML